MHRNERKRPARHQPLYHHQEPQEHPRASGAEEVQSHSEAHDHPQGNQVITPTPKAIANYGKENSGYPADGQNRWPQLHESH